MKIGDRVSYQGEPGWIVNFYERQGRHRKAWALVEFASGHRSYVLVELLERLERTA